MRERGSRTMLSAHGATCKLDWVLFEMHESRLGDSKIICVLSNELI